MDDCISEKQLRNMGQLPMYLAANNHEGVVSRDTYNALQAENQACRMALCQSDRLTTECATLV